jgi:hypothetical protein
MDEPTQKKVFISYSSKNRDLAERVRNSLSLANLDVWFDSEAVKPGQYIVEAITEGLRASDYFLLLITNDSNNSKWVQREISLAFELANAKKLTVLPMIFDGADVPFEFRGLLYIDARQSLAAGIEKLVEFFRTELTPSSQLDNRMTTRKSADPGILAWKSCQDTLRALPVAELRFHLTQKLSLNDLRVLWFDVFETEMENDVQVQSPALCSVQILARSNREGRLPTLLVMICRNHPRFSPSL